MRNHLFAAASATALLLAAHAVRSGPISGYPAATTPLSGSETVIGTQSATTVQITTASIAALVTGGAQTFTGVATFPAPGASKGSIVLTPGTVSGTPPNGAIWTSSAGLFGEIAGVTHQFADLDGNTYTGPELLAAATTGAAGLNVGQGVAPTSPNNGDVWATTAALFVRLNGATQQEAVLGLAQTFTAAQTFSGGIAGGPTVSGGVTINGTAGIWDSGHATQVLSVSLASSVPTTNIEGGNLVIGNGVDLSQNGSGILDCGSAYQTVSCTLVLATLTAGTRINLPDGGAYSTTLAQHNEPLYVTGPQNGSMATIPGTFGTGVTIFSSQDATQSGSEVVAKQPTLLDGNFPSSLCFELADRLCIAGLGGGSQGEGHGWQIGVGVPHDGTTNRPYLNILDYTVPAGFAIGVTGGLGGSGITALPTVTVSGCSAQVHAQVNNGAIAGYLIAVPGDAGCGSATLSLSGGGVGAVLPSNPTGFVTSTGTQPGPSIYINQPGTVGEFFGIGQDAAVGGSLTSPGLRIGDAGNYGDSVVGVWDNRPSQQVGLGLPGGAYFGTGTGTTKTDGGVAYHEKLVDSSGVLDVTTPAGAHTAGVQVGFVRLVAVTVAGLSTADPSPVDGDRASVTDATACTFGSTVTGGGSTHCGIRYDGSASAWKAG